MADNADTDKTDLAQSLLECAARALCKYDGHNPDGSSWLSCGDPYWMFYTGKARIVLQAIREPTDAMVDAVDYEITEKALGATYPDSEGSFNEGGERIVWQAMIDAALEEV